MGKKHITNVFYSSRTPPLLSAYQMLSDISNGFLGCSLVYKYRLNIMELSSFKQFFFFFFCLLMHIVLYTISLKFNRVF